MRVSRFHYRSLGSRRPRLAESGLGCDSGRVYSRRTHFLSIGGLRSLAGSFSKLSSSSPGLPVSILGCADLAGAPCGRFAAVALFPDISFRDEGFPEFIWSVGLVTFRVGCFWWRSGRVGFRTRGSHVRS